MKVLSPNHWTTRELPRLYYFVFLNFGGAAPHSIQNLSSPTGVKPVPLALEAGSLNHWTTREVPGGAGLNHEGRSEIGRDSREKRLKEWGMSLEE